MASKNSKNLLNNIPSWIKIKKYDRKTYLKTSKLINDNKLNTVCTQANCPNRYECFSNKTATFLILGNKCTRNCKYCNINNFVDDNGNYIGLNYSKKDSKLEINNILKTVKKLELKYVVITSVTRDDLNDGGASIFYEIIIRLKKMGCKVEVLIPDFKGNLDSLKKIVSAKPDVIAHNIETVRELFKNLRPKGNYDLSLNLLSSVKIINKKQKIKSGLMVGMGENIKQIKSALKDLKKIGCDIVTVGQYLSPTEKHYQIKKYYTPKEFLLIKKYGESIGIKRVLAFPLVRSSYHASENSI